MRRSCPSSWKQLPGVWVHNFDQTLTKVDWRLPPMHRLWECHAPCLLGDPCCMLLIGGFCGQCSLAHVRSHSSGRPAVGDPSDTCSLVTALTTHLPVVASKLQQPHEGGSSGGPQDAGQQLQGRAQGGGSGAASQGTTAVTHPAVTAPPVQDLSLDLIHAKWDYVDKSGKVRGALSPGAAPPLFLERCERLGWRQGPWMPLPSSQCTSTCLLACDFPPAGAEWLPCI